MIICLIAEGSYPYISGGVASWIHQLISEMPEVQFKIMSIMPARNEELKIKYQLPGNLLEIKTVFLDDYLALKHKAFKKKLLINNEQRDDLIKFLTFNPETNLSNIMKLLSNESTFGNVIDFLQSELFWEITVDLYNNRYDGESFNAYFWTIRSMFLPIIHLLQQESMDADIYHAVSTGYAGLFGVYSRIVHQKPFVLTEHGIYAREREEEIIKAKWVTGIYKNLWIDLFYFISRAAYKEADRIIALFNRNQCIQQELGAPRERTQVISNGVDLEKYTIEKVSHQGFIVGAILRVVPIKDVMTLIRAFKIVTGLIQNVKLMLIGPTDEDPDYYKQCLSLVDILNLTDEVEFTGTVDVRAYMKQIDVLVLTSISEGQPLVILEGMASAIPIVSTDVGSCRQLLEDNRYEGACGLVTNLVSPNETAVQIIRLLNDAKLREDMGKNGRLRVERAYSQKKFIESYKNIYQELR